VPTAVDDLFSHDDSLERFAALLELVRNPAFFERHYEEIEEIRIQTEDNFGEPLSIQGDLKSLLSHFAFEELLIDIAKILDVY
jgi:hypothetical protein